MAVPLFDADTPLAPLREEILARVSAVIAAGRFVLGPEVAAFEAELAAFLGVSHAVGVANGTDALAIALRAVGVAPGDDVVVPAFTFYASAEAIAAIGARPVFADVDAATRNLTPETVAAARTENCRAVVAVDLFGLPAPVAEIRAATGLPVIEDAAQALGARCGKRAAGTLGDIATVSFYPSKNLGAFGDGGAVLTDDPALAETVRALRFHGSRDKQTFDLVGYNSRLDELQAAILRVLLPHLAEWSAARRAAAAAYVAAGAGAYVNLPEVPAQLTPAWHLYVVTHPAADALIAALNGAGVGARGYYRRPLHRQPAMAPYVPAGLELPVTDWLAAHNLALPISPVLSAAQAQEVVTALAAAAEPTAGSRATPAGVENPDPAAAVAAGPGGA
ncbi:DegT/DnrJ/EryC1/StrS aminotransferase family protein [Conexibacter sp. DBS9H8]|uniref:DegT/DnrJ/EryC1/StrS family aminotransferase n=1 Tax=Conexibacter sp. DBS9H8 TaxID=2937801 RepID=UPI00200FE63C|nr:DegT/DnrJ/EryC1/StrS family aminotransferase [Conexibacter sp. DBS9H8]